MTKPPPPSTQNEDDADGIRGFADLADVFRGLEVRGVGTLGVSSGGIGVCDPLVNDTADALARTVPNGAYVVEVALVRRSGDTRVAAARVVLQPGRAVARFEMATWPGQDVRTRKAGTMFGYGVDAGTGCFGDGGIALDGERLLRALEANDQGPTWSYAALPGVVAFSSGYGDGIYTSWWALDEDDAPVWLVTDFGVVDVALPPVAPPDDALRTRVARERLAAVVARLPELGGGAHGDVYETAAALVELDDAAALVAADFVAAARAHGDSEQARDLLAYAGRNVGARPEGLRALLANPGVDDALLAALLAHAHAWRLDDDGARVLVERARASPGVARASLALLDANDRGAEYDVVARALLLEDDGDVAVWAAACQRYRVGRFVAGGANVPAYPAPPEILARVEARAAALAAGSGAADACDDDDAFDTLVEVLAMHGARGVARQALDDARPVRRLAAAVALVALDGDDDDDVVRARGVLRALASGGGAHELRHRALAHLPAEERVAGYEALARGGDESGVIQLGYLVTDPHVGRAAWDALERLLKGGDAKLKKAVKRTLGKRKRPA